LSNEIVSAVFAATSSSALENLMSFAEMLTAAGETPGWPDGATDGATDGAVVGADEPPQAAAARATADSASVATRRFTRVDSLIVGSG
jgi:hypothetical protein